MSWSAWSWYFICKVNSTNRILHLKNNLCTLCFRGWGFHAMTVFICNILQSASITEVFELCLVISQTLGHLAKCFVGMPGRTGGYFSDCLEVWFVGLVVGRNCVSCLVIVVIFMGFGQAGAKRCRMLNSHQLGVAMQVTKGALSS